MDPLVTIAPEQLADVDGAWLNVGVAWGDNNRVAVGTGKPGLNLQFAWGNNNHIATGEGPTLRLDWGSGNTFENR
ncbi:MAG TPA: hypothetical protein VLB44_10570 [Kofleriaceae bacterium]|nr:hypothetical protein [Kofleriaceae bacterium]